MNIREFWDLIDTIDRDGLEAGDEEDALRPLRRALAGKSENELASFEEILSQRLYAIDGKRYAEKAGNSGESPDGFLYMRCYVVARGRQYYLEVKADPSKMPKTTEQWCEPLLYVHRDAWKELTGREDTDRPFKSTVSYETYSNKDLWKT